jgi:hypothetical protein
MLLLNQSHAHPLELWSDPEGTREVQEGYVYPLVISLACIGGCLHGIAMAIRKKYGEGSERYWLEWQWWIGVVADGCAGVLIWPAMPFISSHILVPLIIVVQLGTSYILGVTVFSEICRLQHNIGLACALAGVIGVSFSTSHEAADFSINEFWLRWVTTRFLVTTVSIVLVLVGCFAFVSRTTCWALTAAALEGIQYVCSRSIIVSIVDLKYDFLMQPPVLASFFIKGLCILFIVVFQQLGLESDLSRFAGIYLVGCVLFMCIYGWAFFGDHVPFTITFAISTIATLSGIWLLNSSENTGDTGLTPRKSTEKELADEKVKRCEEAT